MLFDYGMFMIMSIIIFLITGYLLYRLIRFPIKSFGFILKFVGCVMLGIIAWFGLFYLVTL